MSEVAKRLRREAARRLRIAAARGLPADIMAGLTDAVAIAKGEADPNTYRVHIPEEIARRGEAAGTSRDGRERSNAGKPAPKP